jgi:hypothetical protein
MSKASEKRIMHRRPGHPPRLVFALLGAALAGMLFVLAAVTLLAPVWHLWHGDSISWQGWKVPVPKGFCVKSEQNPTMWKFSFGAPFLNSSYGHISLFHRPAGQSPFEFGRDFERFAASVTEVARQDGYRFASTRTLKVGDTTAHCLEFENEVDRSRSLVRCAIEDSLVTIFYEGATRYVPDFLSMFGGMSHEDVPRGDKHVRMVGRQTHFRGG